MLEQRFSIMLPATAAVVAGFLILTVSVAKAADLVHLSDLLIYVFTMEQFNLLCTANNAAFRDELSFAKGWHFIDYSKHMKEEIITGLSSEQTSVAVQSAAQRAREKARSRLKIFDSPDGLSTETRVRRWCESAAKPYIQSVINMHDGHHEVWVQALNQAKQEGFPR
jgi:hypothetical protein